MLHTLATYTLIFTHFGDSTCRCVIAVASFASLHHDDEEEDDEDDDCYDVGEVCELHRLHL